MKETMKEQEKQMIHPADLRALEKRVEKLKETRLIIMWSSLGTFLLILLILGGMFGLPRYKVWQQEMSGRAEFAKAEQNRRIKIEEAKANLESQKLNAQAEVERAKGVAEANVIISDGLKGNEEYLRYLWIQGLQTNEMQVLYIPTEAGLPILEAGKR